MRISEHIPYGCCYAAILLGETIGTPVGHLLKLGGYSGLAAIPVAVAAFVAMKYVVAEFLAFKKWQAKKCHSQALAKRRAQSRRKKTSGRPRHSTGLQRRSSTRSPSSRRKRA